MRDSPFRGIGDGSFERRAGERGGESRQSGEIKRPSGDIRQRGDDTGRPGRLGGQGAEFRCGVMTFIVNQEGIIYQKDIGKETKRRAEAMKIFDPEKTWSKVEETVTQK